MFVIKIHHLIQQLCKNLFRAVKNRSSMTRRSSSASCHSYCSAALLHLSHGIAASQWVCRALARDAGKANSYQPDKFYFIRLNQKTSLYEHLIIPDATGFLGRNLLPLLLNDNDLFADYFHRTLGSTSY